MLREALEQAEYQAMQAAMLVSSCGIAATASAVVAFMQIATLLVNERPDFSSRGDSPEMRAYQALEIGSFAALVLAGTILPVAVALYARTAGTSPGRLLDKTLAAWRERMEGRKLLTAFLDPVRMELLFAEEKRKLRFAALLGPGRSTLLAQLRFIARHANGLARGNAAPEALNDWHFVRLWLLQFLEPLLGAMLTGTIILGVPILLLVGWFTQSPAIIGMAVLLAGLLALARERLESRAALMAMLETLLS
jgi:hypothetical protein